MNLGSLYYTLTFFVFSKNLSSEIQAFYARDFVEMIRMRVLKKKARRYSSKGAIMPYDFWRCFWYISESALDIFSNFDHGHSLVHVLLDSDNFRRCFWHILKSALDIFSYVDYGHSLVHILLFRFC